MVQLWIFTIFLLSCVLQTHSEDVDYPTGPNYPITASLFAHRFTKSAWDATLQDFGSIGGNTVVQRSPPILVMDKDYLMKLPELKDCTLQNGKDASNCIEETEKEFAAMNITISFAVYKNNENFTEKMVVCSKYDRRITYNDSRVTYRLVIPLNISGSDPCNMKSGADVMIVFTLYNGTDPQSVALESAAHNNFTVYLGLPRMPVFHNQQTKSSNGTDKYIEAYFKFLKRVLSDHATRYPNNTKHDDTVLRWQPKAFAMLTNWAFKGYFVGDYVLLPELNSNSTIAPETKNSTALRNFYGRIGSLIRSFNKTTMVFGTIDLTRRYNSSVSSHVAGFENLAKTKAIDILIVGEGRGNGTGCYYFNSQTNKTIKSVDLPLFKMIRQQNSSLGHKVKFYDHYVASNNELFEELGNSRDKLNYDGVPFEFWLNVDAYEAYNSKNKCGPVDTESTNMPPQISRTTKQRMDKALSVAGLYPNKIMATAWDPGFTCESKAQPDSLASDIFHYFSRTIVSYCGWHSKSNMSIVLIGFNVGGSHNNVTMYLREQVQRSFSLFGYYFETDWGALRQRVPSMIYTQLYDMYDPFDISMNGTVTVWPEDSYNYCEFSYDYR